MSGRSGVRRVPVVALALGITGLLVACGGTVSPEQKASQCKGLASDVKSSGLTPTEVPDEKQALEAGNLLDARLTQVGDPSVHDLIVALHGHIHGIETARKRGDDAAAESLAEKARNDVTQAAAACALPESDFYPA